MSEKPCLPRVLLLLLLLILYLFSQIKLVVKPNIMMAIKYTPQRIKKTKEKFRGEEDTKCVKTIETEF